MCSYGIQYWVMAMMVTAIIPATAQQTPPVVEVQDGVMISLIAGLDTIRPEWVSAAYEFEMNYDSQCVVTYHFTECKLNGRRLRLAKWSDGRVVNAPPDLLSFNSTTDTFTCRAGDSLAFYREMSWVDPRNRWQTLENFYSLDSLDYAVELIRLSDSARIALLDSLGMMPSPQPGTPQVHGTRPIMAMVNYRIPPGLDGEKVFLRILLYHRGAGEHWFTRSDRIIINWSYGLVDPNLREYLNLFGQGAPKYPVALLEEERAGAALNVEIIPGERAVAITFDVVAGGATSLGIYDMRGELMYIPYTSRYDAAGQRVIRYRLDQPGIYFAGLLHNGSLVRSRKFTINY